MRSTRWQPLLLVSILAMLLALLVVTRANSKNPRIGGMIASAQTQTWKCQNQLRETHFKRGRSPWSLGGSPGYQRWVLKRWTTRWNDCLERQQEMQRQWDWQTWLPDKWRRIGVCETGLNWHHANSSYVSAFGISVQVYDSDAAYAGVRPWYVSGKPDPSPWEQYQAALGHYRKYGGFSGWGCRGA